MATNQQLKDYIAQQTKLGVSKDTIKSSLLEAGWNEGDITQAMAEAESGTQEQTPLTPAQPFSKPAEPAKHAEKSMPVSFVTSDIFKAKNEPVFQSAGMNKPAVSDFPETNPQIIQASMKEKLAGGGKLLPISLAVLSVVLLGGNIYFFLQNGDLSSKLTTPGASSDNSAQLSSQITSLTSDKEMLTSQIDSLNKTIVDLSNQISIFVPAATSSIVSVPFEVSGILGGGGKLLYSLTTSKNIILSVKNSKDADIDSSLKQLIGMQVKLSGTHQPESTSLTVVNINDQPANATSTIPATQSSSTTGSMATSTSQVSTSSATSTP